MTVMKILFLGDVVGHSGRSAVIRNLPTIIEINKIDFSIVNAENATSGMGLSVKHAKEILEIGADCITLGDHAFDQKDMLQFIETEHRILRPLNFSKSAPGKGSNIYADRRGRKILVSQVLGQVFMKRPFDDPFSEIDGILSKNILGGGVQASLVDIHCEATTENPAFANSKIVSTCWVIHSIHCFPLTVLLAVNLFLCFPIPVDHANLRKETIHRNGKIIS